MATINPQVPVVGEPNDTEDPKIASAIGTIRDAINGGLDNANIADNAGIVGSKLANTSVPTGKIADGAVTAAKMAALSVLSGNIKFVFQSNRGSVITSLSSPSISGIIADVLPGTYLVVAQGITNGQAHSFSIGSSGGAATITQPSSAFTNSERLTGGEGDNYVSGIHVAQAEVTSTTTLSLGATVVAGSFLGSLYVFGVAAT